MTSLLTPGHHAVCSLPACVHSQELMAAVTAQPPAGLQAVRVEANALRKFAVLNYVAVVKAVKKRNRHLRRACGAGAEPLAAVQLLGSQPFFISTKLAALSTRADVLAEVWLPGPGAECPHAVSRHPHA